MKVEWLVHNKSNIRAIKRGSGREST